MLPQSKIASGLSSDARHGIKLADEEFANGNFEEGQFSLAISTQMLDIALSLTPGVGWGKDIYEAMTGLSMVTGAQIDGWDRTFAVIGAVTEGFSAVKSAKLQKRWKS